MNDSHDDSKSYVGEDIPEHSRVTFILVGIVYVIVGVVGNLVIIVTIVTTKSMRNPHYYFIANLAVADILITGYVLPWLVLSLILRYYPVVDFNHCVFNGFLTVCVYVASLISLLAISINRYLHVCHNNLFQRIFSRKMLSSLVGCGMIWLISILCTLPCLAGWGRFVFDRKVHYCGYDRTYSLSYTLFLLLFSIGVPVVIVFMCNFAIWRFVRQASHRIYAATKASTEVNNEEPGNSRDQRHFSREDNVQEGASTSPFEVTVREGSRDLNEDQHRLQVPRVREHPHIQKTNSREPQHVESQNVSKIKNTDKTNRPLVTPDELALMKTVFTVFICFAALMSPYMISTLVDTEDNWPPVLHLSCSYTSFTNSCLNCVLYGLMTPKFKKSFKSLFSLVFRRDFSFSGSRRTPNLSSRTRVS